MFWRKPILLTSTKIRNFSDIKTSLHEFLCLGAGISRSKTKALARSRPHEIGPHEGLMLYEVSGAYPYLSIQSYTNKKET